MLEQFGAHSNCNVNVKSGAANNILKLCWRVFSLRGHLISAAMGKRAWSANVNYGVTRGAPPRKGMTLLCYGCLGGPFTPASFPRAGQELQASGHSNLPPRSGISGPNHFQMAVGPLRSSSSNGGASVPVSSRLRSWRVCADRGL